MPKTSSKSDKSISPEQFLLKKNVTTRIVIAVCFFLLVLSVAIFLNKKSSSIITTLPSGPMAYFRMDRPAEHLRSFRQSSFWQGLSKIDWARYLKAQGASAKTIQDYQSFTESLNEVINSPLFQQFFSKEAAIAIYPPQPGFSNAEWPSAFSGLVMVVRPEMNARVFESLGKILSQHNQEVASSEKSYHQVAITSVALKKSAVTLFYIHLNDLLVMAADERVLHRVIDAFKSQKDLLSQDKKFLSASQGFYNHSSGEQFVNTSAIVEAGKVFWKESFWGNITQQEQKNTDKYLSVLEGLESVGGSFIFAQDHRYQWTVRFDPVKESFFKRPSIDRCVTINRSPVNLIPKEAVIYQWSSCIDFSRIYQQMQQRMGRLSGSPAKLPPTLEFLQSTWGLSLEKDILPLLGGEMGWFVNGVQIDGVFPVPKAGFVFKINDQAAAEGIMHKISTTPITRVQKEEYHGVTINFIAVPLIDTFKPSYAFINGNLFIASTNEMIRNVIDVKQSPQLGLSAQEAFRHGLEGRLETGHSILFMNIREISKQGLQLIEWGEKKYNQRLKQATNSEGNVMQTLQAEEAQIKADSQRHEYAQVRLNNLNNEIKSLEAQVQASAVVMESENTLSQEGRLKKTTGKDETDPAKVLAVKRSQASALQLEVKGFERDLESATSRQSQLKQTETTILQLKEEAEKYHYQVHEVIIPFLNALGSVVAQKTTTRFEHGVVDSEMIVTLQ
ncbi:MAG: DUF3352 domain-containing protein [Candidatus Omnitrophica bacterium]|nr:DUF3352 domain-containing protein [Candidatus Omnitrophota bacterium]